MTRTSGSSGGALLEKVGSPTRTMNPEHIGVKVTGRDVILPDYLFYMMMHIHGTGYFRRIARGTTALVSIRASDVAGIKVGGRG